MLEFETDDRDFMDWIWSAQKPATKDEFFEMLENNDLYLKFLEERDGLRDQRTDR